MGSERQTGRVCDFCGEATAILFCRADAAKLCFACDRKVHSTNQLFTKHTRWLLCDTCGSSPVAIFCVTDNAVLCQNCDWEAHKPGPSSSSGLHDRRPVEGFTGCPSVVELLGILGFEDVDKKALLLFGDDDSGNNGVDHCVGYDGDFSNCGDGDFASLDVWGLPSVVSVDGSDDSIYGNSFLAMGIPSLPKNRSAVCGQHKDQILQQLRDLSKLEPNFNDSDGCLNSFVEFRSLVPAPDRQLKDVDGNLDTKAEPTIVPSYEVNAFQWCTSAGEAAGEGIPPAWVGSYEETNHLVPENDSDLCSGHEGQSHHPVISENFCVLPKVAACEMNCQERDFAISRYKEKKKTRRYEKHIRYESRKVRAESRTRIKGRFAKMVQKPAAK